MPLGVRASIQQSSGHPQEAAAAFGDLLRLQQVAPTLPGCRSRGSASRARFVMRATWPGSRTAYDAAIESMKDGDQDAPILVAARRERAALTVSPRPRRSREGPLR